MASRDVAATAIIVDIESGVSNSEIGKKYGLSQRGLRDLFDKLLAHNLVTREEYRLRVDRLPHSTNQDADSDRPVFSQQTVAGESEAGSSGATTSEASAVDHDEPQVQPDSPIQGPETEPLRDEQDQVPKEDLISETAQFIDVSKLGRNQWWTYALSIAFLLILPLGLHMIVFATWTSSSDWGQKTGDFIGDPSAKYFLMNLGNVILLISLLLVVRLWHKRPIVSLVTPNQRIAWKRIALGFGVFCALLLLELLVSHLLAPEDLPFLFDSGKFIKFLPLSLLLTPIQTTTEELLFRGYLLQMMALMTRNRPILVFVSGLLYMAGQLTNPALAVGWSSMLLYFFSVGAFLTIVTLKTNGLESAIGIHAATNLIVVLFANYESSGILAPCIFYFTSLSPAVTLVFLYLLAALLYLILSSKFSPLSGIMRQA